MSHIAFLHKIWSSSLDYSWFDILVYIILCISHKLRFFKIWKYVLYHIFAISCALCFAGFVTNTGAVCNCVSIVSCVASSKYTGGKWSLHWLTIRPNWHKIFGSGWEEGTQDYRTHKTWINNQDWVMKTRNLLR